MKFFSLLVLTVWVTWAAAAVPKPRFFVDHNRVISGEDAKPNQFPHQVSLQVNWNHICGGAILSEKWILTAAHCIGNYYLNIRAGIVDLNEADGQYAFVLKTIVHPDYLGEVQPDDIALLEIYPPLKFNEAVQPIKLPEKNARPSGAAVISGWGSTSTTNQPSLPNMLQTAKLAVITYEECMARVTPNNLTDESNVCTSPINSNESACSGDSGGPLVQGDVLIGIVSWGRIPCGHDNYPSVFTKVSSFIDFIKDNTDL